MSDSVAQAILRILAVSKGRSLDELYDAVPYRWYNTDAERPTHMLLPSIKKLMDWDLVEAYYEGESVGAERFWEEAPDGPRKMDRMRFYVSPMAVSIEDNLGLNLAGNYNPMFGKPDLATVAADIFVLMPFSEDMKPIYEDHLKKVAAMLEKDISRADDFFATGSIVEDIWAAIYHSTVIVADCTGRNPNVFYEIGIAHTLGRNTVLLAQSIDDIPFDLRHLRVILYEYTPRGMRDFESRLRSTLLATLRKKDPRRL